MKKWWAAIAIAGVSFASEPDTGSLIQNLDLNANRPIFVPTNPRVTTTIRFPGAIGAPEGAAAVFTEDATRTAAEYVVSWQPGDCYLTLTPLTEARLANLNIPYAGRTYAIYVYPVADALQAVPVVNFGPAAGEQSRPAATAAVLKQNTPPSGPHFNPSPAVLVGFLDRLKLVHATPPGPTLASLVQTMGVEVAASREACSAPLDAPKGLVGECSGLNDAGLFQILVLRVVRDPKLNCLGFVCLLRNRSNQALVFDVRSFGVRAGAEYYCQRISDASPTLQSGEHKVAYFVIQPSRNAPLLPANVWHVSVDLVAPALNPGAAVTREFAAKLEAR